MIKNSLLFWQGVAIFSRLSKGYLRAAKQKQGDDDVSARYFE